MRAVSNTSPVSNLAFIGRLSLLKSQFSEIWIPGAVLAELGAHPDAGASADIREALQQGWIKTSSVPSSHLLGVLLSHLHRGEAEAIALAVNLEADLILIDEQEGRQYAAQAGIPVTGVLGILLRAKKSGSVSLLKPEIQALRTKARFFISPALEARVLAEAGE
jgi:predicted nucleic acid-binding protein